MDNAAIPSTTDQTTHADWLSRSPAAIIDFVLTRFHEPLRRDLPQLVARAHAIELSQRVVPLCPIGLAKHLEQVQQAVESHLAKEEKILFPLILAGRGAVALMPIRVMMTEHDDHRQNLEQTRVLTHDFALPGTAPADWRDLYRALQRLEADLNQHIDLENNVLFTRVLGANPG